MSWRRWAAEQRSPTAPVETGASRGRLIAPVVLFLVTAVVWAAVLAYAVVRETTEVVLEYTPTGSEDGVYETAERVLYGHTTFWLLGGLATVFVAAIAAVASRVPHSVSTVVGLLVGGAAFLVASFVVLFVAGFWGDPVTTGEVAVFAWFVFSGCWMTGWAIGAIFGS